MVNKRNCVCERNWNGFGLLEKNPFGQNAPWKKFYWFGFIFASGEMKIRWLYTSDAPREQLTGKNTFSSPPPNSEKLYNFLDALASLESVRRVTDHFFSWDIRSMSWRDFQHYHRTNLYHTNLQPHNQWNIRQNNERKDFFPVRCSHGWRSPLV